MAIASTTMQERVYNEVLEKIITGDLLPETQLVNKKLAQELGVSPTPVREALNRLAIEGMIENHPRWGYFTKKFSPAEVVMILEVRENVESVAARLAAHRITKHGVFTLEEACKEHSEASDQGDMKVAISKDQYLHNAIAVISGNKHLARIIDNYRLLYIISLCAHQVKNEHVYYGMDESDFQKFLNDRYVKAVSEHQDIVEAISNHNEQKAEQLMRAHIADIKSSWAKRAEEEG